MKFMHASGKTLGAPSDALPAVIIFVPGIGETYLKQNFSPSNIDAFLAQRLNFAGKEMEVVKKIDDLKAQAIAAGKPFDEEMAALQKEVAGLDGLKALEAKYKAARTKADQVSADFQSQIDAIVAKRDAAAKDANAQVTALENKHAPQADIDAARAKADAIAQPFNEQIGELQAKRLAAIKPLYDDVDKIETEIDDFLKPYQAKADDIQNRKKAAQEQFKGQINAAVSELRDLVKQDNDQPVN
jgi:DNA repair ATPase RecN